MSDRAKLIAAVVLLSFATGLIAYNYWPRGRDRGNWQRRNAWLMYDIGTGEFFEPEGFAAPPVEPPSGAAFADGTPGGVRAIELACGSCDSLDDRFIGWVERLRPVDESADSDEVDLPGPGGRRRGRWAMNDPANVLIAELPADLSQPVDWLEKDSDDALDLMDDVISQCNDGAAVQCQPRRAED